MTKKVAQARASSDQLRELYAALDVVEQSIKCWADSSTKTEMIVLALQFRADCMKVITEQATEMQLLMRTLENQNVDNKQKDA